LALSAESTMLFTEAAFEFNGKKQNQGLNTMGIALTLSYNFRFDRSLEL